MHKIRSVLQVAIPLFLMGAIAAHASGKTDVIVMLGDSTTLCSRNPSGAKLTDHIRLRLTPQYSKVKIVNSGRSSDTAKGGVARLQRDVLAHEPTVVTVSFGLNDTGQLTPDEYRECMEKIIQSVQTNSNAKILLITSTPFNNARHSWRNKFLEKGGLDEYMDTHICAATRALAKKHDVTLCDLHGHFKSRFRKNPELIDEVILPDGVHLTDKGNEVAADYIAPFIAELLTEGNK